MLTEFEEEIERTNYIEAVARTYRISAEELRKLVVKTAVQAGMATPASRPSTAASRENHKEDGNLTSQKILLTWLIDHELLFEQYEKGEVNPAQIMNYFTEEEEHREAASLFHTRIRELTTKQEEEKAIKETIIRVKTYSIDEATRNLSPTDIQGLQRLMEAKKALQDLRKLHISID